MFWNGPDISVSEAQRKARFLGASLYGQYLALLSAESVRLRVHPLRQFLLRQRSLRPIETSENPRKRGLFCTKLLTSRDRRKAVFVSLRPFVSKAPDFGKTVRIFKSLITCGYLAL